MRRGGRKEGRKVRKEEMRGKIKEEKKGGREE